MITPQSAWTVISKDPETTSWGAHDGYDDLPNEYYSYDSQVGNYRNVQVGDLLFVKGSDYLIGFAQIETIVSKQGRKELRRCPKCGASPEARTVKAPKWRCKSPPCNYEFDEEELVFEFLDVVKFIATYRNTWQDANFPISRQEAFEYQLNRDTQSAIRQLDLDKVPNLILKLSGSADLPMSKLEDIPDVIVAGHIIQVSRRRVGQQEFRLALINRNGENCLISGSQPACVLEASHIRKFADFESHDIKGGLLLRRDFHALFDRHLIRINPLTWQVEAAPQIRQYQTYNALHLRDLAIAKSARPSEDLLHEHYKKAELVFLT